MVGYFRLHVGRKGETPIYDLDGPAATVRARRDDLGAGAGALYVDRRKKHDTPRLLTGLARWRLQGGTDGAWKNLQSAGRQQVNELALRDLTARGTPMEMARGIVGAFQDW